MRVLLVGGGSGGHILPLIAVQKQLNAQANSNKFIVITDKLEESLRKQFSEGTEFRIVSSGKLRRFAHWKWYQYFYPARFKFYILNSIDLFKVIYGVFLSFRIFANEKPDVVFCKGGYVSLPIGIVARIKNISMVLHDSDTRAGLANRLITPGAKYVACGMPVLLGGKRIFTGVPVRDQFFALGKADARKYLNIPAEKKILLVTGGSLGAKRINDIIYENATELAKSFSVLHITGNNDYDRFKALKLNDYKSYTFVGEDYPSMVASADVIISRAGATSIAEFAASGKAVIFIPNEQLSDQLSNAKWLKENKAGLVISEQEITGDRSKFVDIIVNLANDQTTIGQMSMNIGKLAQKDAAKKVANLILQAAKV